MVTVKKSITIKASAKKIFQFMSKPANMAIVIPNVIRNYNVSKGAIKPGWKFDWEFAMMGIPLKGKWIIEKYESPKAYSARTEGMINSTWDYTFSESNGKTEISLTVDYEIPAKIKNKFSEAVVKGINEKDGARYLNNLKVLLEG